ncbi:Pentatricopeptide repeat-containing protein [Rhynchospora pubera]|uniref:Pentatricopeptide repeat-containing protein n=1 Tax=Rhynchospora pubera TaxID=906938 RepID=A0AAV8DQW6_9POAL|nr:Pentatricopeptide repeat-containing protein [Rhynchospora pubera]
MVDILHNLSAMLITCRRQVSRVAQCLKNKVSCLSKTKKRRRRLLIKNVSTKEDQEGVVWRNTILMGEKCRPLNFSGAIHYDSDGNPTPVPRSPMHSPLPYFTYTEKVEAT